eukprot:Nitzschia sp. Nitz4//scaffold176_size46146//18695//22866//NITZ4_007191-RA/size46146-processed-gene-0.33-mRNA-1//-1//CDS//3329539012//7526//frame0
MSDNILDTTVAPTEEIPVVQKIDNGVSYGYQCAQVVHTNTVTEIELPFYIDMGFPTGTEDLAIAYLQEQLVEAVSLHYGVSTGTRCDDPLLDGSSWLVQFISKSTDWTRQELFTSCRSLTVDESTHECFVYEASVTGSVLDGSMDDVMEFMQDQMAGTALTVGSDYSIGFLAVPEQAEDNSDSGRDNLDDPSNTNGLQSGDTSTDGDRRTITIVGGFLIAAFCLAFIGIGWVVQKRRRQWILEERDMHMDLRKPHNGGTDPVDDIVESHDMEDAHTPRNYRSQISNPPAQNFQSPGSDDDGNFVGNIHFDLGTSFKDQLLGVHGLQHNGNNNNRSQSRMSGMMMLPGGGARPMSSDGASDSDADSWAQTDGTIGSLELHELVGRGANVAVAQLVMLWWWWWESSEVADDNIAGVVVVFHQDVHIQHFREDVTPENDDSVRITNCDEEDCEPVINLIVDEDRIPIEYTCEAYVDADMYSETLISLDYEALLPLAAEPTYNARLLQWRMLLAAVEETSLNKCDFEKQLEEMVDFQGARNLLENATDTTTLYAVRNEMDSSAVLDLECTKLEVDTAVSQCLAMRSVLRLKYAGTEEDEAKIYDYVYSLMEEIMVDRSEDLLVGEVERIEFVGQFVFPTPTAAPTSTPVFNTPTLSPGPVTPADSGLRFGPIVAMASSVVLLLAIVLFRRQKASDQDESSHALPAKAADDLHYIETGSSSSLGSPTTFSPNAVLVPHGSAQESESPVDTEDVVTIPESGKVEQIPVVKETISNETLELPAPATSSPVDVDHPLPPRPPRRGSLKLKKRRRRKKKKRRPSLQRVNSRENMSGLEAIPESDSESEFGSEEGSEYSTDDEEGYQESSGSGTPLKPSSRHSRGSGRSHVSELPQQDELFPDDVFANDFDFSYETNEETNISPLEIDTPNIFRSPTRKDLETHDASTSEDASNLKRLRLKWI